MTDTLLFTGTSHPSLAQDLSRELGIPLGKIEIKNFPDNEINIRLIDEVREKNVILLQSCTSRPNHYLMELFLIIDAMRREGAKSIVLVLPYFPYCRQDRVAIKGQPIAASLIASLLEKAGATKVISVDLHQGQIEGFFDTPFLHLTARKALVEALKEHNLNKPLVVAPDIGSIKIARAFAKELGADFAVIDKHRFPDGSIEMRAIGQVANKDLIIVDDICSTALTLTKAATLCKNLGANKIIAAVTHALFVDDAIDQILSSPIEKLYYTNSVPPHDETSIHYKFRMINLAPLLSSGVKSLI